MILKTLKYNENYVDRWPDIIDSVLFAHRIVSHESTKYSPFLLLYNREPTIPIDSTTLEELTSSQNYMEEDDTNTLHNEVNQHLFEILNLNFFQMVQNFVLIL